jgi:hypothetical protein
MQTGGALRACRPTDIDAAIDIFSAAIREMPSLQKCRADARRAGSQDDPDLQL